MTRQVLAVCGPDVEVERRFGRVSLLHVVVSLLLSSFLSSAKCRIARSTDPTTMEFRGTPTAQNAVT